MQNILIVKFMTKIIYSAIQQLQIVDTHTENISLGECSIYVIMASEPRLCKWWYVGGVNKGID